MAGPNIAGIGNGGQPFITLDVSGSGAASGSITQVQYSLGSGAFGANSKFTSDNSGNVAVNSLALPTTTGASTGAIQMNSTAWINAYGTNFMAAGAGNFTATGPNYCVGIGGVDGTGNPAPLTALTLGAQNTIIGYGSVGKMTSGGSNNNVGVGNFLALTLGSFNSVVGTNSFTALTTGNDNISLGDSSWNSITAALDCIGIGDQTGTNIAGIAASTSHNIAIGQNSLNNATSGMRNVAIGFRTVNSTGICSSNTAIGYDALQGTGNSGLSGNVGLGANAGSQVASSNNFYVGNVQQASATNDQNFSLLWGTFSGSAGSLAAQQLTVNGALNVGGIGNSLKIPTGTNGMGNTVTLSSGTATVTSTAILATDVVILTLSVSSGANSHPQVLVSSGSFVVTGLATDGGTYNWRALH